MTTAPTTTTTPTATPPQRDRFITAVRAATLFTVVVVHVSFMVVLADGISIDTMDKYWGLPYVSWVFTWAMPSLFAAGGALALKAARGNPRQFVKRRFGRLMIPYWFFAATMLVVELALRGIGESACRPDGLGAFRLLALVFPLPIDCVGFGSFWYLTVFIPITLAAPWLARLYDRRHMHLLLPVGLFVATFVLDLAHKATVDTIGVFPPLFLLRVLVGWTFFFVVGFWYGDRYHERPDVKRWLLPFAIVATLGTAFLVLAVGYPKALLAGIDATGRSAGNQFPPTGAYLLGGAAMFAWMLWARSWIIRASELPVLRPAVDWIDGHGYTIYIWHIVPYLALHGVLQALGVFATERVPAMGAEITRLRQIPVNLERFAWVVVDWLLLIPLVKLLHPVEQWDLPPKWWRRRAERRASASS